MKGILGRGFAHLICQCSRPTVWQEENPLDVEPRLQLSRSRLSKYGANLSRFRLSK